MNGHSLRWPAGMLLAGLLAGCVPPIYVDKQDYPADWSAQLTAGAGCPELTGRYQNQGEGRFAVGLAKQLMPDTADPLKQVQRVDFDGPDGGAVVVRLLDAQDVILLEQRWNEGPDFRCEDGWLIRQRGYFWATPVLTGTDSERFARDAHGDLLVQRRTEAGGVFLFLPVYRGERFWFRYPRIAQ